MSVGTMVDAAKSRVKDARQKVEPLLEQGRSALDTGVETLKSTKAMVSESAHTLARSGVEAGKEVIEAARAGLDKAREDGMRTAIRHPTAYVSASAARAKTAVQEAATLVVGTGKAVATRLREGYTAMSSEIAATKTHKELAAARKAAVKAKKSARAAKAAVGAHQAQG